MRRTTATPTARRTRAWYVCKNRTPFASSRAKKSGSETRLPPRSMSRRGGFLSRAPMPTRWTWSAWNIGTPQMPPPPARRGGLWWVSGLGRLWWVGLWVWWVFDSVTRDPAKPLDDAQTGGAFYSDETIADAFFLSSAPRSGYPRDNSLSCENTA